MNSRRCNRRCIAIILSIFCILGMAKYVGSAGSTAGSTIETRARRESLEHKFNRVKSKYQSLKKRGCDVSQVTRLMNDLRKARKDRNFYKVNSILDEALSLLEEIELHQKLLLVEEKSSNVSTGDTKIEGFNSIFGIGYAVPEYADLMAKTGAKWVKIPLVTWGMIEPRPPEKGKHSYKWERLDSIVKEYQSAGFHIQMIIKASSPWGAKGFASPPERWRKSYPPKKEHWDNYYRFVYNLVDRYDGDGHNDMPGLRFPIRYYEIESEAQHPIFWAGTVDEYGRLLQTAYNAAKEAHPDTQIILAGINFGGIFDDNPSERELLRKIKMAPKIHKEALNFIRKTLAMGDYFDLVEFHYNRDYVGAYGTVNWIKKEMLKHGYQKPIWAGDAASVPWVTTKENQQKIDILRNPNHPRYNEVNKWLRAEQAKLSIKKYIVAAEIGIEKVILESIIDFPMGAYKGAEKESWFLAGLVNKDGTPRPVFNAYTQLTEKLENFKKVERLKKDHIYLYRFSFIDRKAIYVGWSDEKVERITLDFDEPHVKLEKTITDFAKPAIEELKVENGKVTLTLTDTPIFVQAP